jgi:hypothetical protein
MFQTEVVDKIKTHFVFKTFPPLPENRTVCEIMWKYMVQPDRPQMAT